MTEQQDTNQVDLKAEIIELSTDIVSAYVANNAVSQADLPKLIADVHATLAGLANSPSEAEQENRKPAVPVKKNQLHQIT